MKQNKRSLSIVVITLSLVLLLTSMASAASIKISKSEMKLSVGTSTTLKITGTTKKTTWKSSNSSIATVTSSGKVTGKKSGKATITATVDKKTYKCIVTVYQPIKISKSEAKLDVGKSTTLKMIGTTKKVTWKSSNSSIATVTSSGKVTGKKAGKATITATVNKKTYKCIVTVNKPKVSNKTTHYIGANETLQLKAPELTGTITWKSDNPKEVSVSSKGVVSSPLGGSSFGSATITASTKNQKHYFKIYIDGSHLNKSEILLFEGNTARIEMKYSYMYDSYKLKNSNSSVVKSEINDYTNFFSFEITGVKPGTSTITVVGDGKRTYTLKVKVVKKNTETQLKSKKVVNLLENKYKISPKKTSNTKHYILNPKEESWKQASITVTKDNEYVGILLPPSGTGTESWLSIVKEVIKTMAPQNATSLYNNLISDKFISSTKILEGMNVETVYYGDRALVFESGMIRN